LSNPLVVEKVVTLIVLYEASYPKYHKIPKNPTCSCEES
jgi:hypothetical protein